MNEITILKDSVSEKYEKKNEVQMERNDVPPVGEGGGGGGGRVP